MVNDGEAIIWTPATGVVALLAAFLLIPGFGHWLLAGSKPAPPPAHVLDTHHIPPAPPPPPTYTKGLSVGGLVVKDKEYYDKLDPALGYKLLDQGRHWGLYEKDGHQVLVSFQSSSGLATGVAATELFVNGKPLEDPGRVVLRQTGIHSFEDSKGRTVYCDGPVQGPEFGQPRCGPLLAAFEQRDSQAFKKHLTPELANLRLLHGSTILTLVTDPSGTLNPNGSRNRKGTTAFVEALLKAGADATADDGKAFFQCHDVEAVRLMIKSGVPVDLRDKYGASKLFGAGKEMADLLLKAGANPNLRDNNGRTPAFRGWPDFQRRLVKSGADLKVVDKRGNTVLHEASARAIPFLLEQGLDINQPNHEGLTPLMVADRPEDVRLLLKHKADLEARDKAGRTALFYLTEPKLCKILLEAGADPKVVDKQGQTPLFAADDRETFFYLLYAGVDPDIRDNKGKTARERLHRYEQRDFDRALAEVKKHRKR